MFRKVLTFFVIILLTSLNNVAVSADEDVLIRGHLNKRYVAGETQKKLAAELSVDSSTISRYLRGQIRHSPTITRNFKSKFPLEYRILAGIPNDPPSTNLLLALPKPKVSLAKQESFLTEVESVLKPGTSPLKQEIQLRASTLSLRVLPSLPSDEPVLLPSRVKKLIRRPAQLSLEEKAPIVIAYREEGEGKGAYFDHYTIQRSTDYPTRVISTTGQRRAKLGEYIRSTVYLLKYGKGVGDRVVPEFVDTSYEEGLLIIPGRLRDNEKDEVRNKFEQELIRQARNRGQPILALCAGSWQVWKAFGGKDKFVEDHCYNGGMIRISEANGRVVYNIQIHRIKIEDDSLLARAMNHISGELLKVNSVHWKTPDENSLPSELIITARSVADSDIAPNRRVDNIQMAVEEETVEAFENKHGAPLLGIQWHPEAYNKDDTADLKPERHRELLQFMAKAGTAYYLKRRMLREFEEIVERY